MNKRILRDFFLAILVLLLIWHFSPAKEILYQFVYDLQTRQQPVRSHQEIDRILAQFEQIPVEDLDQDYLDWTQISQPSYQKILANTTFYKISGKQIFQFIVGDFRIKHLLPQDDIYRYYIRTLRKDTPIYLLINKELLYKLLDLQNALFELGYNLSLIHI